ncbi:PAS domain S-box-containing protein [Rubricella aquisinus]|uniref:histidine kinase n=1 Tax=Rubricella aquisinus TaxID=2028108 RepID=A0A840X640_9RHOB|nr:PAS domain-containing hybrid sensor histidine kinase/response regulator [Rubricella aquisinus]MBB5516177.1 PAS domain S-box-containing protein [Rubricella aquisinus]
MTHIRLVVVVLIALLLGLFAYLGTTTFTQVRGLSTAAQDDMLWTISQTEVEIANLAATLAQAQSVEIPDTDMVTLRANIALSRLGLLSAGQARVLIDQDWEAQRLQRVIDAYATDAAAIVDGAGVLTPQDIDRLSLLTTNIRPSVRALALRGLELGVESAEARRMAFISQLRVTGIAAMGTIIALGLLLLILDQLLAQARLRDAALKASRDRLGATVAASLDAIVIAGEDGRIVEFNDAAETIFGWKRDDVIGQPMEDNIIPDRHRAAHLAGMNRYIATKERRVADRGRVEMTALRKSGEEFPVEINITTARDGTRELFIAYLRDISARKISEQNLIDARDRAESMDRAKSQILAVMSHEMRTPLNGILGVLDLLRTTPLDAQQKRYVEVVAGSGEILLAHVNEALDITRLETGALTLTPQPVELLPLTERITDVLRPLAQEKGLELTLEFDPSMARAFVADGGRIGQILTNLVGNAIKFTQSGRVSVEVTGIHGPDATAATLIVSDTGEGIPSDQTEAVFEDFVVLNSPKGRRDRGDGLGLPISRKLARLMGGDITVQSVVGQGSSFVLKLMLERVQEPQSAALPPPSQTGKSVLVANNDPSNRAILREMILGLGHNVTEASNGLEALNAARAQPFDLILMDSTMPVMDGRTAGRFIRSGDGPNTGTMIVGLVAEAGLPEEGAVEPFTSCLPKPVRIKELRDLLAE